MAVANCATHNFSYSVMDYHAMVCYHTHNYLTVPAKQSRLPCSTLICEVCNLPCSASHSHPSLDGSNANGDFSSLKEPASSMLSWYSTHSLLHQVSGLQGTPTTWSSLGVMNLGIIKQNINCDPATSSSPGPHQAQNHIAHQL